MVYQCWFAYKLLLNEIHAFRWKSNCFSFAPLAPLAHLPNIENECRAYAHSIFGLVVDSQEKIVMDFARSLSVSVALSIRVCLGAMCISSCNSMRFIWYVGISQSVAVALRCRCLFFWIHIHLISIVWTMHLVKSQKTIQYSCQRLMDNFWTCYHRRRRRRRRRWVAFFDFPEFRNSRIAQTHTLLQRCCCCCLSNDFQTQSLLYPSISRCVCTQHVEPVDSIIYGKNTKFVRLMDFFPYRAKVPYQMSCLSNPNRL